MSNQVSSHHDAFFKRVLGDPRHVGTFLREHLPADVAELLGPEPPEPVPGSFVDDELRQQHSDLLFRVQLKVGRGAFAYVLMEHKSAPDPGARLQLLKYVVRILTDWYDQNKRRLPLPLVLPLLAHQGPQGWTFSTEFMDLFGTVPEPLRPYLPTFRHALVDLARIDNGRLSADPRLRMFLKALKYVQRSDLNDCLQLVLAEAPLLTEADILVTLTYFDRGSVNLNHEVVREVLSRLVPERAERMMGCITQPFFDKGKAEGKAEEGTRILIRLLEKRFGLVPDSVRQRIFAANVGEIESWVDRVVDAPDLWAVFESN